jgi:Protein of unknown function (DUF4043)
MAETTARSGLTPQQWDSDFFTEYTRESRFKRYVGTNEFSMIHAKEDLTRKPGDKITFAAARSLGGGVTGNQVLEGNESELDTRSKTVTVAPLRNAVVVTEWDEQKSAIDLRNAGRSALKVWAMEKMREDIITAFKSIPNAAGVMVPYETATAAERNAWLVANADRVQFGALVSNAVSGVQATALATVDSTSDKLTAALVSMVKRRAQTARPRMTPIKTMGDQEWYVMFANPMSFRDLSLDATIIANRRDALERGKDNPLFTSGDIIHDGVIIREIPEMGLPFAASATSVGQVGGILAGVGASSIDVGFNFLCGAQALGMGWARRLKSTTDVRDYGFRNGVGVMEVRGIEKLMFGTGVNDTDTLVQNGIFTVFTSATPDL